MAKFTITIDDEAQLAGITAAREAFNLGLALTEGQAVEDHPEYLAADKDYVQFVMSRAAESYAIQYAVGSP